MTREVRPVGAVQLRGVTVGAGRTKVAASLCATAPDDLLAEADRLLAAGVDVAEWRVDHLLGAHPDAPLGPLVIALRARLDATPLLVTVRSIEEGGQASLTDDHYATTVAAALQHGGADAVDLELARSSVLPDLVARAHEHGVRVVVSSHDVAGTPPADEISARLAAMAAAGGDIVKAAATARGPHDVLELLRATHAATQELDVPVVTMAMGPAGLVSRLCGEVFGSAITFGALDRPSAPGQIDVRRLREMVDLVHQAGGPPPR